MKIENVKVKVGDVFNLQRAIQMLVSTASNTSGRVVYSLNETSSSCEKILVEAEEKRKKIAKKYLQHDKEGKVITEELSEEQVAQGLMPKPLLKDDKDGDKMDKEMRDMLGKEVVLKVRSMNLTDFGGITFDPKQNPFISIIMDIMVDENESKLVVS